ncbi:MAG: glycosyltransferase [Candidatus Omnitrophota bacterium]
MKTNPDTYRADISVVIPTCNRPVGLRRLLDSLSKQTIRVKEIIVVDNGEQGKITPLISSFSGSLNIRYFFEPSKGISIVRNKGISVSTCPIIAFLDDDCVAQPQWLEAIDRAFQENRDIQILQGNTTQTSTTKNLYVDIFQADYKEYIRNMLSKTPGYVSILNTQNFAVKRELITRFRMPFEERLATNEDLELYWKLNKMGIRVAYSEEMKADHYACNRFLPFLRVWYRYGFGKSQIKRLHPDFSDEYYIDNTASIFSCLRMLYREIFRPRHKMANAIMYYPVLIAQKSFFIAGMYMGRKMPVPAYKRPATPPEMVLFVTNECNLSCRHCFYQSALAQDKREIKASDTIKILRSLTRDLETVCLGGGEPFINKELAEICKAFAQNIYLKDLYIVSNGFETNRIIETTEDMLKNSFFNIHLRISLDGMADSHNRIRGNELAFSNAVATIKALKDLQRRYEKLQPSIQTIISQLNIGELTQLAQFVKKEIGVMHVFDIIRGATMFYKNGLFINESYGPPDTSQLLTHKQLKYAAKTVKKFYREYAQDNTMKPDEAKYQETLFSISSYQALKRKPIVRCSAGKSIAVIFPNYDVSLCEAARPIGNLADHSFDFTKIQTKFSTPEIKNLRDCCYCTNPCYISSSIQNMRGRR